MAELVSDSYSKRGEQDGWYRMKKYKASKKCKIAKLRRAENHHEPYERDWCVWDGLLFSENEWRNGKKFTYNVEGADE